MNEKQHAINWFRDSSPYINAHRGKTFVIILGGDALASENLSNIISDITLLNSLGIRLILVHGAMKQIKERTATGNHSLTDHQGRHIVLPEMLAGCTETISALKAGIEAQLSKGLTNSPMHGADLLVTSGNFVKAKPLGIIDGIDHHHSGSVRRINKQAISQQLDSGAIVLQSPLGYSLTGEIFFLEEHELGVAIAIAMRAEKLIIFSESPIHDAQGNIVTEVQTDDMNDANPLLQNLKTACEQGVNRGHIISHSRDGAILEELFTRDGSGTQVTRQSYEQIRKAVADDVAGILALISPLETEGVLVRRPRELLESEINHFTVIERDGLIVGCAALYPFSGKGELACLATHPEYRNDARGDLLLRSITSQALAEGLESLFVLTTQTIHWFIERGFCEQSIEDLPDVKKATYNYQRNSKLLEKPISN